jgi:hypothetical protein
MQIAGCLLKSRKNVQPCKTINIDGQGFPSRILRRWNEKARGGNCKFKQITTSMAEPNPEPLLLFLQTNLAIIGPTCSTQAIQPTSWFQRDFRKGNSFMIPTISVSEEFYGAANPSPVSGWDHPQIARQGMLVLCWILLKKH